MCNKSKLGPTRHARPHLDGSSAVVADIIYIGSGLYSTLHRELAYELSPESSRWRVGIGSKFLESEIQNVTSAGGIKE